MAPSKTILSALVIAGAACGGGESAVAECEALVEAYCSTWARCTAPEGDEPWQRQRFTECQARAANALACADAESTSARYGECLDAIETIACVPPFGFESSALPTSCIGAIRLK